LFISRENQEWIVGADSEQVEAGGARAGGRERRGRHREGSGDDTGSTLKKPLLTFEIRCGRSRSVS